MEVRLSITVLLLCCFYGRTIAAAADGVVEAAAAAKAPRPPCPGGYYTTRKNAASICVACQPGFFSTGKNAPRCTKCPSGRTSLKPASTSCPVCAAGRGGSSCATCAAGTWSAGGSTAACQQCATGFTTEKRGATNKAACTVCAPGFGGPACAACPAQTHALGGSKDDCVPCDCSEVACQTASCNPQTGICSWAANAASTGSDCLTGEDDQPGKCDGAAGTCVPCEPLTCAAPIYAGRCGLAINNGCGLGTIDCACSDQFAACNATTPGVVGECIVCTPRTCSDLFEGGCGIDIDDGCGGTFSCSCPNQFDSCSQDAIGVIGQCLRCVPKTCGDFPLRSCFRNVSDGCGSILNCGCANPYDTCSSASTPGVVGTCIPCARKNCASEPYAGKCGVQLDDTCGGLITLCNCANRLAVCSSKQQPNVVGTCLACTPRRCTDPDLVGKCVRSLPDGCGSFLTCSCAIDQVCPNTTEAVISQCACKKKECGVHYNCGTKLPDGCGGIIESCSCGTANAKCSVTVPGTTGGVCDCTASTCADFIGSRQCGTFSDGCGGTLSCFDECLASTQTCSANQTDQVGSCVCQRTLTCTTPEYERTCGQQLTDGCGSTINCGCRGTDVCSVSAPGVPGYCRPLGCVPRNCWSGDYERKCGRGLDDGCGGFISCPCQESGQTCSEQTLRRLGVCFTPACPNGEICGTREKLGLCGFGLPTGCSNITYDCQCSNPDHTCTATTPGVMAACKVYPRGPDGACVNTPALPSSPVDASDRTAISRLLVSNYVPHLSCYFNGYAYETCCDQDTGFAGSTLTCTPFTLSAGWVEETRRMVNFFRLLAGLNPVQFTNATMNDLAARAALLQAANVNLAQGQGVSANPPSSWKCASAAGQTGSRKSNLIAGHTGARAVISYMDDAGNGKDDVVDRRLLLGPTQRVLGTGDAWPTSAQLSTGFLPVNALWSVDELNANNPPAPCPAVTRGWVSWPPAGAVPHVLVYSRWHISFEGLGGSGSTAALAVAMTCNGSPVTSTVRYQVPGQVLVWEPALPGLSNWRNWIVSPPTADIDCSVTISGVGASRFGSSSISYRVTVFYAANSLKAMGEDTPGVIVSSVSP